MALVTLNPMFTRIGGRMGNLVFYSRRGTDCVRRYIVPRNPDTPAQRVVRDSFSEAVHAWQALGEDDKRMWNRRAVRSSMSGYNLFISRYMKQAALAASGDSAGVSPVFPSRYAGIPDRIHSVPAGISPADRLHTGCNTLPHDGIG